jgi:hypothetical protein
LCINTSLVIKKEVIMTSNYCGICEFYSACRDKETLLPGTADSKSGNGCEWFYDQEEADKKRQQEADEREYRAVNELPYDGLDYPDGRFEGAFQHEGPHCPECGKLPTGPNKQIACNHCGWTDF